MNKRFKDPVLIAIIVMSLVIAGLMVQDSINRSKSDKIGILPAVETQDTAHKKSETEKPITLVETNSTRENTAIKSVFYKEETVSFNPTSLKYHKLNCKWAKKCKQCIKIPKTEAIKRGGEPCRVCSH